MLADNYHNYRLAKEENQSTGKETVSPEGNENWCPNAEFRQTLAITGLNKRNVLARPRVAALSTVIPRNSHRPLVRLLSPVIIGSD